MKQRRSGWGLAILTAFALYGLVRLLRQPVPGHYRVFTTAARLLWNGQMAYGSDFGTGVGYWFYSPSCGLYFFGPLSLLPEWLGLTIYMVGSLAVFVWGARAWMSILGLSRARSDLFYVLVSPLLMTAVTASKLEILMTGVLLGSSSWLYQRRRGLAAAALLGLIVNWKFQTLPSVGLLLLVLALWRWDWEIWGTWAGTMVLLWLAPLAVMPAPILWRQHEVWKRTLGEFVAQSWTHFDNGFAFLINGLKLPISFEWSGALVAIGAVVSVLILGAWAIRARSRQGGPSRLRQGMSLALSIGCMYSIWFSPLHQNNAFIIYSPLLMALLLAHQVQTERRDLKWAQGLAAVLVIGNAVMILAYSDLVPLTLRGVLREISIKAVFCLLMTGAVVAEGFKELYD